MVTDENDDYDCPVGHETTNDRLEELEDEVSNLKDEIDGIKSSMITWGGLGGAIAFFVIFALWGDKIWGFIKLVGALIITGIMKLFQA